MVKKRDTVTEPPGPPGPKGPPKPLDSMNILYIDEKNPSGHPGDLAEPLGTSAISLGPPRDHQYSSGCDS